jgi:hypothetical protein
MPAPDVDMDDIPDLAPDPDDEDEDEDDEEPYVGEDSSRKGTDCSP